MFKSTFEGSGQGPPVQPGFMRFVTALGSIIETPVHSGGNVFPASSGIIEERVTQPKWDIGFPSPKPRRSGVLPTLLAKASSLFIDDPYLDTHVFNNKRNETMFTKLQENSILDDRDIVQMDHIGTLLDNRAKNDAEKQAARQFKDLAKTAMVENQYRMAEKQGEQFKLFGQLVDPPQAKGLIEKNISQLIEKGSPLSPLEAKDYVESIKPPSPQPLKPAEDNRVALHREDVPPFHTIPPAKTAQGRETKKSNMRDLTKVFDGEIETLKKTAHPDLDLLSKAKVASEFLSKGEKDFQNKAGWPKPGQAALYQGKIVSSAYFGNAAYGYAARRLGLSREDALKTSELYSLSTRLKVDQRYDRESIISGMDLYDYGNPWQSGVPYLEFYGGQLND